MSATVSRAIRKALAAIVGAAVLVVSPGIEAYAQVGRAANVRAAGQGGGVRAIVPLRAIAVSLNAPAAALVPLAGPTLLPGPAPVPVIHPILPGPAQSLSAPALPLDPAPAGPTAAKEILEGTAGRLAVDDKPAVRQAVVDSLYNGRGAKSDDFGSWAAGPTDGDGASNDHLARSSAEELRALASNSSASDADRRAAVASIARLGVEQAKAGLRQVGTANPEGGAADYEIKRAALRALAELGEVVSMPPISQAHKDEILKKLAAERPESAIIDYDGTLEEFTKPITPETGAALKAAADADVEVMILTDRPDVAQKEKDVTIIDSLEPLTVAQKQSVTVGANRGARMLLYDRRGSPRLIREEPGWNESERKALTEASGVVSDRFGRQEFKGKTEDVSAYGYAKFLRIGLPEAEVKAAASLMASELAARGLKVEVIGRKAYKETDPPYLTLSKIDKSLGVGLFLKGRGYYSRLRDALRFGLPLEIFRRLLRVGPSNRLEAKRALVIGDHFFGSRNVDVEMLQSAPGALGIAVGGLADPRLDNIFVWPTQGAAATREVLGAVASRAPPGELNAKALGGQFFQGIFSISAFILTAIAYPFIAIPAVGPVAFGALMAFGPLAAIATGPLNGLIANRLSARNAMALNALVRGALALALPAFALFGILNFWTLLLASIANGWLLSSVMTTENIYLKAFSGNKHIGTATTVFWMRYLLLQVVLTLLIGVGSYIDGWSPMVPFYISAAVHAFVVLPIIWLLIPNTRLKAAPSAGAVVDSAKAPGASFVARARKAVVSFLKSAGALIGKYRKEALLFAAGLGVYFIWPTAVPAAAALVFWVSRTEGFKKLWANPGIRYAMLFASLAAFIFFPLQSYAFPFIATTLAGTAGKAALLGQMLGALFFGQLIANSSQAKLPSLRIPLIGRINAQRLLQAGVLALGAAWIYLGLFPGSLLAAGLGVGIGAILMALSEKLTNRGWITLVGIGLSAILIPYFFWGNIPLLLAGILMIGLFYGPASTSLSGYFYKNVPSKESASMIAVQGSFFNGAISLGYGLTALAALLFSPVFPGLLLPMGILFAALGVLFAIAPRLLPGLPDSLLHRKKEK